MGAQLRLLEESRKSQEKSQDGRVKKYHFCRFFYQQNNYLFSSFLEIQNNSGCSNKHSGKERQQKCPILTIRKIKWSNTTKSNKYQHFHVRMGKGIREEDIGHGSTVNICASRCQWEGRCWVPVQRQKFRDTQGKAENAKR